MKRLNVFAMTAQPDGDLSSYEVIHLGGEAAAVVPLPELRRLQAVQRHASAELLEDAEVEATLAAHREWVAAGRRGVVSMRWRWRSCSATRRVEWSPTALVPDHPPGTVQSSRTVSRLWP
jgi:hypothetical protein